VCAQAQQQKVTDTKPWESALAFSQSLSQWALLVTAGSIVILVGASYRRPQSLRFRLIYLLFVPGWIFLATSLFHGMQVQSAYVAYLLGRGITQADQMNQESSGQINSLFISLAFFAGG